MRCKTSAIAGLAVVTLALAPAFGRDAAPQSFADPNQWHPIIYCDLSTVTADNAAYNELWAQDLATNDKAYAGQDARRFQSGHAPATESHMVVRGTDKTAVISILNTATGCTAKLVDQSAGVAVKMCPLKIAIYVGSQVTITSGRKGCILETIGAAQDEKANGTFVGYDQANKAFRIGTLINHEPVPGCSSNIPLFDRLLP